MNKERLLNVARALRESQNPERFIMGYYFHNNFSAHRGDSKEAWCGTPACALGHFAVREDLQDLLAVGENFDSDITMVFADNRSPAYYDSQRVCEYFDINCWEARCLFSATGCGGATTPIKAAEYIERFVAEHS